MFPATRKQAQQRHSERSVRQAKSHGLQTQVCPDQRDLAQRAWHKEFNHEPVNTASGQNAEEPARKKNVVIGMETDSATGHAGPYSRQG